MMDKRMKALEAVAEALRTWCASRQNLDGDPSTFHDTQAMFDALRALVAIPATPVPVMPFYGAREPIPTQPQPAVEVVTLALWVCESDGSTALFWPDSLEDNDPADDWRRLGTVTLPLSVEPGA